jgi:hypothetical protein
MMDYSLCAASHGHPTRPRSALPLGILRGCLSCFPMALTHTREREFTSERARARTNCRNATNTQLITRTDISRLNVSRFRTASLSSRLRGVSLAIVENFDGDNICTPVCGTRARHARVRNAESRNAGRSLLSVHALFSANARVYGLLQSNACFVQTCPCKQTRE